jgi:hypothetical protein
MVIIPHMVISSTSMDGSLMRPYIGYFTQFSSMRGTADTLNKLQKPASFRRFVATSRIRNLAYAEADSFPLLGWFIDEQGEPVNNYTPKTSPP